MADNFINYAGNATIPREIITERLNETIKKLPEESIDVVDFVHDDRFKLLSVAGVIDSKYSKLASSMTEEEMTEARDQLNATIIPNGIVIENTIPIKDITLKHDLSKNKYRLVIFEDANWILMNKTTTIIGIVLGYVDTYTYVFPIVMTETELGIELSNSFLYRYGKITKHAYDGKLYIHLFAELLGDVVWYLNIWYAIQVTLLNPLIQFRTKEGKIAVQQKSRSGKKKSPKIKYYKTIYIESEELDQFFDKKEDENGKTHYHCLMWYVTGHWRHYANGKKVFIQGYWKGEGRFSGIEAETRQRELVLDEDDLPKERVPKPKEPARRLFVDSSYDEHVHCECGQLIGSDHLAERCEKCNTLVMYRN